MHTQIILSVELNNVECIKLYNQQLTVQHANNTQFWTWIKSTSSTGRKGKRHLSARIEQILFPHHALVATLLFFVVHSGLVLSIRSNEKLDFLTYTYSVKNDNVVGDPNDTINYLFFLLFMLNFRCGRVLSHDVIDAFECLTLMYVRELMFESNYNIPRIRIHTCVNTCMIWSRCTAFVFQCFSLHLVSERIN